MEQAWLVAGRSHLRHGKLELGTCIALAAEGAHGVGDVGVRSSDGGGVACDCSRSDHGVRLPRARRQRARASGGARDTEKERRVIGDIDQRDVAGRDVCRGERTGRL